MRNILKLFKSFKNFNVSEFPGIRGFQGFPDFQDFRGSGLVVRVQKKPRFQKNRRAAERRGRHPPRPKPTRLLRYVVAYLRTRPVTYSPPYVIAPLRYYSLQYKKTNIPEKKGGVPAQNKRECSIFCLAWSFWAVPLSKSRISGPI